MLNYENQGSDIQNSKMFLDFISSLGFLEIGVLLVALFLVYVS